MFSSYLDQSYLGVGSVPPSEGRMVMPPPIPLPSPATGLAGTGTVTLPGGMQVPVKTLLLLAAGLLALYMWRQRQS